VTTENEQRILDGSAWREFCRALERAGEAVCRDETPTTAFDRAEGYRYLARLLRAGLESQLEFGDPRFPGFFQLANETIKIGNDNPDNCYRNANISGRHRYRIHGHRGTAPYLSFGTKGGSYDTDGTMRPTGQIDAEKLEVDGDGRFSLEVSCAEQPGNWLPMQPGTTQLVVRETFTDRAHQEPARLRIERVGGAEDARLDPAFLETALQRAVAFVSATANLFVDWMVDYDRHPNTLPSDDQEKCQRAGGDANIHYCQSRWRLGPDEALLVEAPRIPEQGSWNFQLSNFWMESLDYRFHRIHLNPHTAKLEPDGALRIVVAHKDPGPDWPNWLDTTGHDQGGMLFRWIGCEEYPPLATRVVPFASLREL